MCVWIETCGMALRMSVLHIKRCNELIRKAKVGEKGPRSDGAIAAFFSPAEYIIPIRVGGKVNETTVRVKYTCIELYIGWCACQRAVIPCAGYFSLCTVARSPATSTMTSRSIRRGVASITRILGKYSTVRVIISTVLKVGRTYAAPPVRC